MKRHLVSVAVVLTACVSVAVGETTTLQINAGQKGTVINPRMYGVFLEEIGHGVDGGLYAEKLQNRAFEDAKAPEGFHYVPGNGQAGGGRGRGRGNRTIDATGGRWVDQSGMYATIFPWKPEESLPYWSVVTEGGAEGTATLDHEKPLNENTPRSCKCLCASGVVGPLAASARMRH